MTRPLGKNELESNILKLLEDREIATVDQILEELVQEDLEREEVMEAIRRLVSRDCILLTRDWRLQVLPDHDRMHH